MAQLRHQIGCFKIMIFCIRSGLQTANYFDFFSEGSTLIIQGACQVGLKGQEPVIVWASGSIFAHAQPHTAYVSKSFQPPNFDAYLSLTFTDLRSDSVRNGRVGPFSFRWSGMVRFVRFAARMIRFGRRWIQRNPIGSWRRSNLGDLHWDIVISCEAS